MRSGRVVQALGRRPKSEAVHGSRPGLPEPVRFRTVSGRGLVVNAWVNGAGSYKFAVDTGAGATLLSKRVAEAARVAPDGGRRVAISGLSGAAPVSGQRAVLDRLAIGDESNLLPSKGLVIVTSGLPPDVDGVLDPTEAFWPLGYVIDMPKGELSAFDPRATPVRPGDAPPDGAVVPWLSDGQSRRPFVRLDNGRRALVDTGSGLGLAVSERAARAMGLVVDVIEDRAEIRDLAGGSIRARRIPSINIGIGPLVLRHVPTDLLLGAESGAPIVLGREALYPFRLTFDPVNRLIRFAPA
jgi:predicted aspartyl protease